MEGIVDPALANQPPTFSTLRQPSAGPRQSGGTGTTGSNTGSMFLQDALHHTSRVATSLSGSSVSDGPTIDIRRPTQAEGKSAADVTQKSFAYPFTRTNPFQSISTGSSIDGKSQTPPSPHTLGLSSKHVLSPSTQPRRPSQLRNVKMGSMDSETSGYAADSSSLQPLAPAWDSHFGSGLMFNDPFGPSNGKISNGDAKSTSLHPSTSISSTPQPETSTEDLESKGLKSLSPVVASSNGPSAAWAAPESWGVEADEPQDEAPSSGDDDEEQAGMAESELGTPPAKNDNGVLQPSPLAPSRTASPFGHRSDRTPGSRGSIARPGTAGGPKARNKTASGRPSTSARPSTATGRPGTASSMHASILPVSSFSSPSGRRLTIENSIIYASIEQTDRIALWRSQSWQQLLRSSMFCLGPILPHLVRELPPT